MSANCCVLTDLGKRGPVYALSRVVVGERRHGGRERTHRGGIRERDGLARHLRGHRSS